MSYEPCAPCYPGIPPVTKSGSGDATGAIADPLPRAQRRGHRAHRLPALSRGWLRLQRNLRAGRRLATFGAVQARDLRPGFGQIFLLAGLSVLISCARDYLQTGPQRFFDTWGMASLAANYLVFFAGVIGLSGWILARRRLLWLATALLAAAVYATLGLSLAVVAPIRFDLQVPLAFWYAILVVQVMWVGHYTFRAARVVADRRRTAVAGPVVAYLLIIFGLAYILPQAPLWYSYGAPEDSQEASYEPLDTEGIYYAQWDRLEASFAKLAHERPGVSDVYFVGFGSDASQDVFMKEVAFVRGVVERRFDARGRTLSLVNNRASLDTLPLANPSNLRIVLGALGQRINVGEDVLFLYITSHGSRDGTLSVNFPALAPNSLTAPMLREMLDESGIKWRILVISACFSGSFIADLEDPHTLVLTAAHAKHTSFGCTDTRELTYFAEHLFQREMAGDARLLDAFQRARVTLEAREKSEGHLPSDPQMFMGAKMRVKLEDLEQ